MHRAVGVSALVGLLAVLAFGTLYGMLGVLVAIPVTAVIQVLLDTLVLNVEPARPAGLVESPWADLRTRARALRRQARLRLRTRSSRMGIDPATADHVVDAVDQRIEAAVGRVEQLIAVAEAPSQPLPPEAQAVLVEKLQGATEEIEAAVERVDPMAVPAEETPATHAPSTRSPTAMPTSSSTSVVPRQPVTGTLRSRCARTRRPRSPARATAPRRRDRR